MNIERFADISLSLETLPGDSVISPEAIIIMNQVKELVGGSAPSESIETLPY